MELVENNNIGKLFRKYFFTAVASCLIICVYSLVDMICVGQYEGPVGSAALSVVMPTWSVILSIGLLIGVGGSVLFSLSRGAGDEHKARSYFTLSVFIIAVISAALTVVFAIGQESVLRFFGADDTLLPYALAYLKGILPAIPLFASAQVIILFLRNDNDTFFPALAIILAGVFNIVGDITFVFTLDMGIAGAGLATGIAQYVAFGISLIHFFRKKNTLKFVKPEKVFPLIGQIFSTGLAPFLLDLSAGIMVIVFNNQIMAYAGDNELAVYGCVANITALFVCLYYSVGEALQPIVSVNYGGKKYKNVTECLKHSVFTAVIIGIITCSVVMIFPEAILKMFMDVNDEVMAIGPAILRSYAISYLVAGLNIAVCHYFQAILKTKHSIIISVLRGYVISIALIYILPLVFGFDAIWYAIPVTEFVIFAIVLVFLRVNSFKCSQQK